jgi:hypothetical protein
MTYADRYARAEKIMAAIRARKTVRQLIGRFQCSIRQLQRYAVRAGVALNHGRR